ncbi:unnamed protein product [Paramecium octaurelia]|uniref:Uncharacterized protein n=1 Tax=Paramecium octaurelia TaxID=43137 RepID=A0A8S1S0N7_PAROT|nr:unnamed protein product [Paramecium octaurelia]
MIILFIIITLTRQTIINEFNANSQARDGWEGSSNFNTCGEIQFFGSPNAYSQISRIFLDLEPHSHIIVDAQYLSIGAFYLIQFYIDLQLQNIVQVISSQSSICSGIDPTDLYTISITNQHNRGTLWINIQEQPGGLISLKLSIIKCQYECAGCIENYDTICLQWKLHQYSFNQKQFTYSDGWTFQSSSITSYQYCGNCQFLRFYQIKYQTYLPPHQDILIRFFKLDPFIMIVDYIYDKLTINAEYLIEILIRNHRDPILQLNIYSAFYNDIRDFELFYTEPEITFKNLNEGCLEQINDKCLICQEGWIQDEFLENCHPICGDGIIQGQEQCDYIISNHSCIQCKYSCVQNCQICQFGICLQCIDGFIINSNFTCDPFCGDGNLIPYSVEQCELTVNGVWDGCQDCRFISIANCKTNYFSICFECEVGFQMLENVCFPYCGDKLVLQQYEDCDDGNFEPYDGCFQCKFQCIEDCNICDRGQCILKCGNGYEFVNNNCLSVCGDQVVTKEEDCDDGNMIKFDGCFQCKYSCPENCYDCYQGTCLECIDQYQLLVSNQCKQQLNCGDGLVQEEEECDDGNYYAADGCKDCIIEQNWACITIIKDSPSQCTFVKAPNLFIHYLNMTQNKQYISIQFTQQVKIYTPQPLSETLKFELPDIDKQNWNSRLYIIQDVGSYLSFGEYIVQIEVYQLLKFRPLLKILVNQKVANIDNAILVDLEEQITLQYPNYLDQTQKGYSQSLKSLNQYLIYSLSAITILSMLLGSGDLFIEILAILQFQQYLRYINLQYPENLVIYFSINDLITVQPLLDFLQFPQLLQFIDIKSNSEYCDGKFNVYKQNSSLIINLSCQIFQCLIFLFLILLFRWVKRALYISIFCSRYFYFMSSLSLYINPKIILKISQSFYKICLELLKLEKFMSLQGLQKALLLNGWDMIFKTLLYTRNIQTKNYLDAVQVVIVIIILLLYFNILLNFFKSNQQLSNVNRSLRFEIISFGRQFFFLLFLIYVQNSQILQLGLLLLTSLIQTMFLQKYHLTFNQKNYIVQMVVEISVIAFILSSFLYIQEFNEQFNQKNKILLGWFQAILLSTGIIIELLLICQGLLQKYKLMGRRKQLVIKNPLFI